MAGVYLHVPFCASYCTYCDFYSILLRGERERQYREAVLREIDSHADFFEGVRPTTLYVGGGTPSVLSEGTLELLVEQISKTFFDHLEEFTVEVNPDDVTPRLMERLRAMGCNRLSMGVQSFFDEHLRWMNRRHTSQKAVEAFRTARAAGFDNISLDLIFGFSGLSTEQWDTNISRLLELHPEHVSCYQMSIEKGSALGAMYARGEYCPPDDEMCADQYARLQSALADAGYNQYEISNFALPGRKSRHNSSYWERTPYLGLGPAAHSFDGDRTRLWNPSSLKAYCSGAAPRSEILSDEEIFDERIMLGLRKTSGLNLSSLGQSLPERFLEAVDTLVSEGSLVLEGDTVRIPPDRLFVSDGIMVRLFA